MTLLTPIATIRLQIRFLPSILHLYHAQQTLYDQHVVRVVGGSVEKYKLFARSWAQLYLSQSSSLLLT